MRHLLTSLIVWLPHQCTRGVVPLCGSTDDLGRELLIRGYLYLYILFRVCTCVRACVVCVCGHMCEFGRVCMCGLCAQMVCTYCLQIRGERTLPYWVPLDCICLTSLLGWPSSLGLNSFDHLVWVDPVCVGCIIMTRLTWVHWFCSLYDGLTIMLVR